MELSVADTRKEVVQEIFSTEIAYVRSLITVIHGFEKPLRNIIKLDEVQRIFSNVETILNFHKVLLRQFEEAAKEGSQRTLGEVFCTLAPFLNMYTAYCENFEKSTELVKHLKLNNAHFLAFLKTTHERIKNLDLEDYLLMPIQRIPRYQLLLQELIKNTEDGHLDLPKLKSALIKIKAVAENLNVRVKEAKDRQKLLAMQILLNINDLVVPGRTWLYTGHFYQSLTGDGKNNIKQKTYLFNDVMIMSNKGKKVRINLALTWVTDFPSVENAFLVITPDKTFVFIADDSNSRSHWLTLLTEASQTLLITSPLLGVEREKYVLYSPEGPRTGLWRVQKADAVADEDSSFFETQPNISSRVAQGRAQTVAKKMEKPQEDEPEIELVWTESEGWHLVEKEKQEKKEESLDNQMSELRNYYQEWVKNDGSAANRRSRIGTRVTIGMQKGDLAEALRLEAAKDLG